MDTDKANIPAKVFDEAYQRDETIDFRDLTDSELHPDFMEIFSVEQISKVISSMKNSGSPGPDNLPVRYHKETLPSTAWILHDLFKGCLETGWTPDIWRTAIVVPIFKGKGSPSDPRCYRPISITCVASKVMEKCILNLLVPHLIGIKAIPDSQFGFIAGRRAIVQLLQFYEATQLAHVAHIPVVVIYIDVMKAFDRVKRTLLCDCLVQLGLSHVIVRLIMSHLCIRTHRIRVGSALSELHNVPSCVVQGSVLGAILFVTYTAPLAVIARPILLSSYADDVKWIFSANEGLSTSQRTMDNILIWLQIHGLEMSPTKSIVIHRGSNNPCNNLVIGNGRVGTADVHVDLGVLIQKDYKFSCHVTKIINKSRRLSFVS